jgi:hypothetical protein
LVTTAHHPNPQVRAEAVTAICIMLYTANPVVVFEKCIMFSGILECVFQSCRDLDKNKLMLFEMFDFVE